MFCREWLAQLGRHQPEIEAAGLRVVAVGIGEPKHAQRYCPQLAPRANCVSLPEPLAHAAYGLTMGTLKDLLNAQSIKNGWRAMRSGHTQSLVSTGNERQLGGTFVVSRAGIVEFAQVSAVAGDHADIPTVLAAHRAWEARNA